MKKFLTRLFWVQWLFGLNIQRAFLEDVLSLLQDGLSVNQAVDAMRSIATGLKREAADSISYALASGQGMAAGMTGWFSSVYVEIINAGESTGVLTEALEACASAARRQDFSVGVWLSSLLYPLMVVTAALGVVVFVKNTVLARFTEIKSVSLWPMISQNLFYLATWVERGWLLALVSLVLLVMLTIYALRNTTGVVRSWLDLTPIFNLYRQFSAARLMRTLGLLLNNGIMLKRALSIMRVEAKPYLAWHLWQMELQLANGRLNIADVLDTRLIERTDMVRLRIVATGKGFAQALWRLGEQGSQRHVRRLVRWARILGGMLLLLGAFVAMMLVLGIYSVSQILAI